MSIFKTVMSFFKNVFSWVDLVIDQYNKVKEQVPGLIEYIENLYDMFAPKITSGELTSSEAREELLATAEVRFSNSPIVVPRAFLRYVLELVHMKRNQPLLEGYDREDVKKHANRILKGLYNKYGDR